MAEMNRRNDQGFLDTAADLPTGQAAAFGGSRAQGTHRPDSDWDLAVYYQGPFDPADLRAPAGRERSPKSADGVMGSSTGVRG